MNLNEQVKDKVKADVKNSVSGKGRESPMTEGMLWVKYHQQATDFARGKGWRDPPQVLREIEDLSDLKDPAGKAVDWEKRGSSTCRTLKLVLT